MLRSSVEHSSPDVPVQPSASRRRIIIVAPHFAPSNLASTHRSRLFAQHLPDFGWEPVIVTVDHRYYEERLDWKLAQLISPALRVERVAALPTKPVRLIGDIGIRGFWNMLSRILHIIDKQGVDFIYITVPSFFAAPLGRLIFHLRGVPYGIDYSDPWVHTWPGSERPLTKAWISRQLGSILEPFAVRHASLITGVSDRTYRDIFARNPHLVQQAPTATIPYGGEPNDHALARRVGEAHLFSNTAKFRVVYAGTMWDGGRETLSRIFRAIGANPAVFADVEFCFIGTGLSPTNPLPQVRPLAEDADLPNGLVVEHPARISYMDVLAHLEAADSILVLGSNKPHYTPSKIYQSILARRPILAVLHEDSPACRTLVESQAAQVLSFNSESDLSRIERTFVATFARFRAFATNFDRSTVNPAVIEEWSARAMTGKLVHALNESLARQARHIQGEGAARPSTVHC